MEKKLILFIIGCMSLYLVIGFLPYHFSGLQVGDELTEDIPGPGLFYDAPFPGYSGEAYAVIGYEMYLYPLLLTIIFIFLIGGGVFWFKNPKLWVDHKTGDV